MPFFSSYVINQSITQSYLHSKGDLATTSTEALEHIVKEDHGGFSGAFLYNKTGGPKTLRPVLQAVTDFLEVRKTSLRCTALYLTIYFMISLIFIVISTYSI